MSSPWRHLKAAGSSLLAAAGHAGHALAGPYSVRSDQILPPGFYEWRAAAGDAPYIRIECDGVQIAAAVARAGIAEGVLEAPGGRPLITSAGVSLALRPLTDAALAARALMLTANRRTIFMRWRRQGRLAAARALIEAGKGGALEDYETWVAAYETPQLDRQTISAWAARLADPPMISVVTPVYETPQDYLAACLASVRDQAYPHWEHCLVDDASPGDTAFVQLQTAASADARVRVTRRSLNGGIAAATTDALAMARGAWIAFLDHDDTLSTDALALAAAAIAANPAARILYTDEDKIDENGARSEPYMKGGWNPSLFAVQNYLNHLTLVRRDLIDDAGGLRPGFEGSQDYDLLLRCAARVQPNQIVHIPAVAYHWRFARAGRNFSLRQAEKTHASMRRAFEDNTTAGALLEPATDGLPYPRLRSPSPSPAPLVSLVIPSRDAAELLAQCIATLRANAGWDDVEFIVMDNDSRAPDAVALLAQLQNEGKARVAPYPGAFNFSAINNDGARLARGAILGFVNNDIEAQSANWLAEMLRWFSDPKIAAVGPKLLYPDGRIQHAGLVTGVAGGAGHLYKYREGGDPGPFAHLARARDVSALTGACLLVRADAFRAVGGFDETAFPVAFNDVDLCLKLRAAGHRLLWTPDAVLIHHESASRGADNADAARRARLAAEKAALRARWPELDADPYYSPNLTLADESGALAWPPRWRRPWA